MKFTCHTEYNQKALTAMARAVRKTVRAKKSRRVRVYSWVIIGISLVSFALSLGSIWTRVANGFVIVGLLLIMWKEDAINGFFAKRKALPGSDAIDVAFYPDYYLVNTVAAESKWQYDKIVALAESRDYILFVIGDNHAMAMEKATLEGGSIPEFCRFIEEMSGQKIQDIGR